MRKSVFSFVRVLVLALLVLPITSCEELTSSTEGQGSSSGVTPEVSVPEGYENYFVEDLMLDGGAHQVRVAFQINVDWTMCVVAEGNDSVSWCSIESASGNAGLHKVLVSVAENDTYAQRIAKVQLMCDDSKVAEIVVSQGFEDVLLLDSNEYDLSYEASTIEVELSTTVDYDYSIEDGSWVRKREGISRAVETYALTFEVDENTSGDERVNYIHFYNEEYDLHEIVVINQAGNPNSYGFNQNGMYVYGEATADVADPHVYAMDPCLNEATYEYRSGMYEKFVVLEGGKEFYIVLSDAGEYTKYGAVLQEYNVAELADNPTLAVVKRGELEAGDNAPAMKVDQTGLYHIVLDLNLEGDLQYPQIIVSDVQWGVRGAMNGWGFTAFDAVEVNAETMTWKIENVDMPANGEFKFAYGNGWKIQLDDAGCVKASTNLGVGSQRNGANIAVGSAGLYTITLTYTLNSGHTAESFDYMVECTQESSMPETMYIIGNDFGNWDWASDGVVEMTPVHSHPGHFWAIRHMTTTTEFKFCARREWNGDFTGQGNNSGYIVPGNCMVEADSIYMIYVDLENNRVVIEPANVYGMGDCFGGWDAAKEENKFVTEGTTLVSPVVIADSNIRMYAAAPAAVAGAGVDWWQMEFNVFDGVIEYRGAGGDQTPVAAAAGQKVTLDFNAGTGFIR